MPIQLPELYRLEITSRDANPIPTCNLQSGRLHITKVGPCGEGIKAESVRMLTALDALVPCPIVQGPTLLEIVF